MDTIVIYADGTYVQCFWRYPKWNEPLKERRGTLPRELLARMSELQPARHAFDLVNGALQYDYSADERRVLFSSPHFSSCRFPRPLFN